MTTKPFEEFMSEINSMNIEEALSNAEKCLEAFEVRDIIKQQQETINRQKAEIERLKALANHHRNLINYLNARIVEIKAEAVKEVIARAKEYFNPDISFEFRKWLDSLEKELAGEG